jgi:ribonuclease R
MMQAQYSPDDIGHYGLAAPTYLHFTSPIRRYPDLMVHRLLHSFWARAGEPLPEALREEKEAFLAGVAAQCSERERAAMKAERDVEAFYAAVFLQDRVGEEFAAVVGGVAAPGLFCELESPAVEGLVPAESLGDGARFDADLHRLVVGRSGASYAVGDAVRVRVESADPVRRRITLSLVAKESAEAKPARAKERRARPARPPGAPSRPRPSSPAGRSPRRGGRPGRGR